LVPNFILLFFKFFFVRRSEKELLDFSLERESYHWGRLWAPKRLVFVSKDSIWLGRFLFRCFFYLKTPKNRSKIGKNFCFGWISGFGAAVYWVCLWPCIGLTRSLGFFYIKNGLTMSFWVKNKGPCFSSYQSS